MNDAGGVAVIAGASLGLGDALAEVLVGHGYHVAALGRDAATRDVARVVPDVVPIPCDLASVRDVDAAFSAIEAQWGSPTLTIYNAHRLELRPSTEISPEMFEASWRAGCFGAYVVAKRSLPAMRERGRGTLIFTGATSSVRGGAKSAAFASSKFALRGLAQSLAKELGPLGIHVAHVVLDGLIWSARTHARFSPERERCMPGRDVASVYLALAEQPRTAWTHEVDVRPASEPF